jgi:hypothetical protein
MMSSSIRRDRRKFISESSMQSVFAFSLTTTKKAKSFDGVMVHVFPPLFGIEFCTQSERKRQNVC